MPRLLLAFLSLLPLVLPALPAEDLTPRLHQVDIQAAPSLAVGPERVRQPEGRQPAGQGVSAPFAANVGDGKKGGDWYVLVAGGCNFPDQPAAEGGKKVFYDDIFILDRLPADGTPQWHRLGRLPGGPTAYGVGVAVPQGVVCVGGTDGERSRAEAWLLSVSRGGSPSHPWQLQTRPLPPLPLPLDNMAGAYGGGYVYIAGGQSHGLPSQAAFRLRWPDGQAWERLPDLPGPFRLQPVAAVQDNGRETAFYLLGGYAPPLDGRPGMAHSSGYAYHPLLRQWKPLATIHPQDSDGREAALVGAVAVGSGCHHIVCMGGVDKHIFEQAINSGLLPPGTAHPDFTERYLLHPAPWYRFNERLLIYHTVTDTWVSLPGSPRLARAGAGVADLGDRWIVVNGEEKPGLRSTDVTTVRLTQTVSFGWLNWAVLIAYLLGMMALGRHFMRRESGADDFFKGGGRIPWWAAGISIYATMLSAITYMAYPAKAYATDWTYYPMLVTILLVSFPVVRYYLPFFRQLQVASAYEYLERRFNAATRLMASALFIVFMVARMALVLYLPSLALTAVTGISLPLCIVLMAIVTIAYCTMGGVEAVVWGDVVQGFILVGGAVLAVVYLVCGTEGGLSGFVDIGSAAGKFRLFDWSLDYRSATFWVILVGGMANNLISYTSDQTVIQRYLTTKDAAGARRSILLNGVLSVVVSILFFAIGAGLYTFFKTHPAALDFTMAKADTIFPYFMMSQLPQGLAGLLIAAIFAATMSTISSNINSVATAFSVDFYQRWRPATTDRRLLRVARSASLVAGLIGMGIALLMATWEIRSLLDFFQEILGLLSSGLGGLFLMGRFFPRIGGRAALVGFATGVLAVFLVKTLTPTSFLLYGAIGMAISVSVAWLLSFLPGCARTRHSA